MSMVAKSLSSMLVGTCSCPDYQNEEDEWNPLASKLHKTNVRAKTKEKLASMKKEMMQVYVDGFPQVRKLDGNFVL